MAPWEAASIAVDDQGVLGLRGKRSRVATVSVGAMDGSVRAGADGRDAHADEPTWAVGSIAGGPKPVCARGVKRRRRLCWWTCTDFWIHAPSTGSRVRSFDFFWWCGMWHESSRLSQDSRRSLQGWRVFVRHLSQSITGPHHAHPHGIAPVQKVKAKCIWELEGAGCEIPRIPTAQLICMSYRWVRDSRQSGIPASKSPKVA